MIFQLNMTLQKYPLYVRVSYIIYLHEAQQINQFEIRFKNQFSLK